MTTIVLDEVEHDFDSDYSAACWLAESKLTHDELKRLMNQCKVKLASNLSKMWANQQQTQELQQCQPQ